MHCLIFGQCFKAISMSLIVLSKLNWSSPKYGETKEGKRHVKNILTNSATHDRASHVLLFRLPLDTDTGRQGNHCRRAIGLWIYVPELETRFGHRSSRQPDERRQPSLRWEDQHSIWVHFKRRISLHQPLFHWTRRRPPSVYQDWRHAQTRLRNGCTQQRQEYSRAPARKQPAILIALSRLHHRSTSRASVFFYFPKFILLNKWKGISPLVLITRLRRNDNDGIWIPDKSSRCAYGFSGMTKYVASLFNNLSTFNLFLSIVLCYN